MFKFLLAGLFLIPYLGLAQNSPYGTSPSPVPNYTGQMGGKDPTGRLIPFKVNSDGSLVTSSNPQVTATPTGSVTPTFTITHTPNLTATPTQTLTFTPTITPVPIVDVQPQVTVVNLGRYSVNPAASATPAVIATAIPSATPIFHKVVASYNNSGTAGGGIGLWAPTKLNSVDVIAPAGGVGIGSTALVVLYGPGQALSLSGPDCSLGAAAGCTITGYIFDYQSFTPFKDMQR